jgi:DNA-binding GntR family transcriptional regulator
MTSRLAPLRSTVRPFRLREAAYKAIKQAILSRQVGADQPLLEGTLAELLEISRTPVREALALLEHDGLLSAGSARGLWVTQMSQAEFLDLFAANETVEPSLARLAAIRSTDDQVDEMRQTLEASYGQVDRGDVAAHLAGGRRFHQLVGEAAGNVALTRFVVQNEERTDMYILTHSSDLGGRTWRPSVDEHNAILEAIARREPEEAARLVIYHSQSIRHRLVHLFRRADDD